MKRWMEEAGCCRFITNFDSKLTKGLWGAIFTLPALIAVFFVKNPQVIVTYTGGIAGTFILFIFPLVMVYFARKRESELTSEEKLELGENPNESPF